MIPGCTLHCGAVSWQQQHNGLNLLQQRGEIPRWHLDTFSPATETAKRLNTEWANATVPWQRHAKVRGPHHPCDCPLWQTIFEHQLPGCRCSSRAGCVLTPNKLLQGSVGIRPRPSSSRGPLLCWFAPHQSATAAFNHVQTNRDKAETHPHFGKKTKTNKQTNKQITPVDPDVKVPLVISYSSLRGSSSGLRQVKKPLCPVEVPFFKLSWHWSLSGKIHLHATI